MARIGAHGEFLAMSAPIASLLGGGPSAVLSKKPRLGAQFRANGKKLHIR